MNQTSPQPEVPPEPAPTRKLPMQPLTAAGILLLVFVIALTLNFFAGDDNAIDHEAESMTDLGETKVYANPTYGVEMRIPSHWEFDQSDSGYFVETQTLDFGCAVGFMPDTAGLFRTMESTAEDLKDTVLAQNANFQFLEQKNISLSGSPAVEVSFSADVEGTTVLQDYLLTQRGSTVYAVILTQAEAFQETCAEDFDSIRAGIVIPK
jgi:hypothetical protein